MLWILRVTRPQTEGGAWSVDVYKLGVRERPLVSLPQVLSTRPQHLNYFNNYSFSTMVAKQRIRMANEKHSKNITLRGNVAKSTVGYNASTVCDNIPTVG